ncbi:hypothetical protein ACWIG5_13570 [Streptomyces lydicus]
MSKKVAGFAQPSKTVVVRCSAIRAWGSAGVRSKGMDGAGQHGRPR